MGGGWGGKEARFKRCMHTHALAGGRGSRSGGGGGDCGDICPRQRVAELNQDIKTEERVGIL
jgi:hypothetical protein